MEGSSQGGLAFAGLEPGFPSDHVDAAGDDERAADIHPYARQETPNYKAEYDRP